MNKMFQKISFYVICFLAGIITAIGVIYYFGTSPVRFDNPFLSYVGVEKPEIVGFLPYWLIAKADKNYSQYITTLTYFGLTVDSDGSLIKLANAQEQEPGWTALNTIYADKMEDARKHNLKQSLLVISGDEEVVGEMMNDPVASAQKLVADAAPIMKEKGFTDLNLDIEVFMEASESARASFTTFAREIKNLLVSQKLGTLTIDLIPIALVKEKLYDARALGEIADRIVLMTYDYHYSGSFTAGAVAPVGGAGTSLEFDVETAVKEALKVMPAKKILLGIPLYGYQWETIENTPEAATIPGGSSTASVRRIAEILSSCASCSAEMDAVAREPYLIFPEGDYYNQIYYENEWSIKEKIALAQKYHLGGVALWALGYEDDTMLSPLAGYKNSLNFAK